MDDKHLLLLLLLLLLLWQQVSDGLPSYLVVNAEEVEPGTCTDQEMHLLTLVMLLLLLPLLLLLLLLRVF
jgi:hypothetical protein